MIYIRSVDKKTFCSNIITLLLVSIVPARAHAMLWTPDLTDADVRGAARAHGRDARATGFTRCPSGRGLGKGRRGLCWFRALRVMCAKPGGHIPGFRRGERDARREPTSATCICGRSVAMIPSLRRAFRAARRWMPPCRGVVGCRRHPSGRRRRSSLSLGPKGLE